MTRFNISFLMYLFIGLFYKTDIPICITWIGSDDLSQPLIMLLINSFSIL
jgi:hypothetical protein